METYWSDLPTFRDCAIAAVGVAPRGKRWSITVKNAQFDIKVYPTSRVGFTGTFGMGSMAGGAWKWFSDKFFKKSVERFRMELLDIARCDLATAVPQEKYIIDGQGRWTAVKAYISLSYRHSRRLFETIADKLASSEKITSDLWRSVIQAVTKKSSVVVKSPWRQFVPFDLCKDRTNNFSIHTGISPPAIASVRTTLAINAGGKSVPVFRRKIERNLPNGILRRHPRRGRATHLSVSSRFRADATVLNHWCVRSCPQVGKEHVRDRRRSVDTHIQLGLGSQLRRGTSVAGLLIGGAV
jgi:hypothetical protein